ncbi:MAG: hypothetical protein EOP83_23770 [Verrucomicrobiaceae bacterium]|nr:MAG: hypothetical protein EOP83_23770 [Verrucomicrobiaceae bacterium]
MRTLPFLCVALLALMLGGCATSKTGERASKAVPKGKKMVVRTTAYTHTEAGGSSNAVGGRLRFGGAVSSAASDWSWLPLGTRFRMLSDGREYVIEDYGSALVGRKTIDLYKPNRKAMNSWGVRNVEIEILEWGSRAMSLKLLQTRMRNKHVRRMVASLQAGG